MFELQLTLIFYLLAPEKQEMEATNIAIIYDHTGFKILC